jgi:hypothetical protein
MVDEYWREYNDNGNEIHYKNPRLDMNHWNEYDKHNNNIFYLNTNDLIYLEKISYICGIS